MIFAVSTGVRRLRRSAIMRTLVISYHHKEGTQTSSAGFNPEKNLLAAEDVSSGSNSAAANDA
jgi:hypothetical protein